MNAAARRFTVVPMTPKRPVKRADVRGWPLREPIKGIDPQATLDRMTARSALQGIEFRDGKVPELTDDQARDIAAWTLSRPPTSSLLVAPPGGWWAGLFSRSKA